jgi:hypothetical protein
MVNDKFYKRSARSGVLMKCVTCKDGYNILCKFMIDPAVIVQPQRH